MDTPRVCRTFHAPLWMDQQLSIPSPEFDPAVRCSTARGRSTILTHQSAVKAACSDWLVWGSINGPFYNQFQPHASIRCHSVTEVSMLHIRLHSVNDTASRCSPLTPCRRSSPSKQMILKCIEPQWQWTTVRVSIRFYGLTCPRFIAGS